MEEAKVPSEEASVIALATTISHRTCLMDILRTTEPMQQKLSEASLFSKSLWLESIQGRRYIIAENLVLVLRPQIFLVLHLSDLQVCTKVTPD